VIKISLPPLSERKEDIPLLVDHFIEHFNSITGKRIVGLSQEAMTALMLWDWPGNIRELENAIEHAFVLCKQDLVDLQYLPEPLQIEGESGKAASILTLKDVEKLTILEALRRNQWKKVATARELGIDKNTLRRKINRLGINIG
jgi:DNA-binding NtrC family response regulator